MIEALLLDLDDTLLDDRHALRTALHAFFQAHGAVLNGESPELSLSRWRSISAKHWQRYENGKLSFDEQRRERVREFLGKQFNDAEADYAFMPYLNTYQSSWKLVPYCLEFLKETAHIPKVIVTNGERSQQYLKVQSTGLTPYFLATITPMDCGYWKPESGIFLAALDLLKVKPENCMMIGDDLMRDIQPAQTLNMSTFLINHQTAKTGLLDVLVKLESLSKPDLRI